VRKTRAGEFLLIAVLTLGIFAGDAAPGKKYEPTWESLKKHDEVPEWFRDGKIGIYFHWGVYTVPADAVRFGEDNIIAIRVFDMGGTGGLYKGPLLMK